MSLSDLASLGSFVSGIAVLVSLIFLYFQVRQLNAQVTQAERYQQTLVKQARTNRVMDVNARLTDASFAHVNLRAMTNAKDLTLEEWLRFNAHARAVFQNGEDTYSQHLRGLLHKDDFHGFQDAFKWMLRGPAIRVAWATHRQSYPPAYATFVDRLIEETPVVPFRESALEKWKADMAVEIAKA